jgi:hypothetical protein
MQLAEVCQRGCDHAGVGGVPCHCCEEAALEPLGAYCRGPAKG